MSGRSAGASPTGPWPDRLARYREKLLENLVFLLPGIVLSAVGGYASRLVFGEPWRAVFLLGPLAVAAVVLWYQIGRGRGGAPSIGKPYRAFLALYLLTFGVAAGSSVLEWKRTLVGFEDAVPRNWLALNRLGDWRYWVARREPPRSDLVILTTAVPLSREEGRAEVGQLIGVAAAAEARGIAFDFYFQESSELDPWLCAKVRDAGIPVLAGYGFTRQAGTVRRRPYPESLEPCFPRDSVLGHTMGYREADNRIRSIPLSFAGAGIEAAPSLSWRVASAMAPPGAELPRPRSGLLRFLPTAVGIPTLPVDTLFSDPDAVSLLRDSFVLVGEGHGSADTARTPFGTQPGVAVHALAVQALLNGRFIEGAPWWASLAFLLVSCLVMTAVVSQGERGPRVLLIAGGLSLAMVLAAAASMRFWLVWVDVSYALVGMWLLVGLTLAIRARTARPAASATPAPGGPGAGEQRPRTEPRPLGAVPGHAGTE